MRFIIGVLTACAAWAGEVSGVVVADDGMPFFDPVAVRIHCAGSEAALTMADGAGRFRFPDLQAVEDCELTASTAGYRVSRTAVRDLPAAAAIPALVLHRTGKYQGESLSVSHLAAPPAARSAFQTAMRRLFANEIDAALAALESAVAIDSRYASAWFEIGRLKLARNDAAGARSAFARAVAEDPWFVSPYEPLLLLERAEGNSRTVRMLCEKLHRINPHRTDGCNQGE